MISKFKTKNLIAFITANLMSLFALSQSYTFTPCGAIGRYGPSQTQVNNTYSTTGLNGAVTVSAGIQSWTVPASGIYKIECLGAKGGNGNAPIGGSGAKVQGDFTLTAGQVVKVLAGQSGGNGIEGGGGGGSFVTDASNSPMIIAGGGGGAAYLNMYAYSNTNMMGNSSGSGMDGIHGTASVTAGLGGSSGSGGQTSTSYSAHVGSGGGGLLTDGASGVPSTGGLAFVNGGTGGAAGSSTAGVPGDGGFGGGGGGDWTGWEGAGGGGGYSGGGGGVYYGCGGGGGSYNAGANAAATAGYNSGPGYIIITKISGVNIIQTASISCYGELTAALTASAFGGTAPYSFSWTPSVGTSSIVTGLAPGSYSCRVTDANSIVYTSTFLVTQPSSLTTVLTQTNLTCFQSANGAIKVNSIGGSGTYSYTWVPAASNSSVLYGLSAGGYTCSVSDANGCIANVTTNISQPSPVSISGIASNATLCSGNTCILAGTGAQSYTWTGGIINGVPFTPTITNNYTVTGVDAVGCTGTAAILVVVNPTPTVTISGSTFVCSPNSLGLTATGATNYTWSTSQTGSAITVTPTSSGVYTVVGSNAYGCQSSATKSITIVNPPIVTANASSLSVCSGNTLMLYGGGANTYTWSGSVTNGISFVPTATDTYTVTGTNACGTNIAAISVTVNNLPNVTANTSSTLTCATDPVTLSGGGASSYTWTGGITDNVTFYPTTGGTYTVTGTDLNGCRNTAVASLSVKALPSVSANISSTLACLGSSLTLFGSGANSYSWSSGVTDNIPFAVSITTNYIVTGTGPNGCQNYAMVLVTATTVPSVTANTSSSSVCQGGTLTLFGTGTAVSYSWNPTAANNTPFAPSGSAIYTVTGTNMCGSTDNTISITVNPLPNITASATANQVCANSTVALIGGGGISYTLSSGLTNTVPFTPTITATYTITGKDNNGCKNTAQKTITVLTLPTVSTTASTLALCIGNSLTLNASGADTYTWNPTATNGLAFAPPASSIYSVVGTNTLTGCTSTNVAFVTITVNPLPVLNIIASNTAICQGATVSLTGANADVYSWSNGITNNLPFTPAQSNSYTLTGTNTLTGCSNTLTQNILILALPAPSITASGTVVCAGSSVIFTGSGNYIYNWSNGINNGSPFFPSASSIYTVVVTDSQTSCNKTETISVTVNPLPVVSSSATSNNICIGNAITLSASGANTYTWNNGVTNAQAFTPVATAVYTVAGTNTLTGCTSTNLASQTIVVNAQPIINISGAPVCSGETAVIVASGAVNYTWSTSEQTLSIEVTPTANTNYTVTGTDANGCFNSAVYTQTVSDCTGINENTREGNFLNIYPNPNSGRFFISAQENMSVEIFNQAGQLVKAVDLIYSHETEINMSDLSKGIYFVKAKTPGGIVHTKKLILTE